MPKPKNPYYNFETCCLRAPILPLDTYFALTSGQEVEAQQLQALYADPMIKEALYLASPEFYAVLEKTDVNKQPVEKDKKRLFALLKYLSRMTSRCTPFGLFAGCGSGTFGDQTLVQPVSSLQHRRRTRYDMHYLVKLGQELAVNPAVREQLLWYPNSSLYSAGMHYRYVEYTYLNKRRQHSIEAVAQTEYLKQVLAFAKAGKTIQELANTLVDEEITLEDATAFIEELITNQLLVNVLEPTVTGTDYLEQLVVTIEGLDIPKTIQQQLVQQLDGLGQLDQKIGNAPERYSTLQELLSKGAVEVDPKYLFQTDLFLEFEHAQLDRSWIHVIKKGITFLNKITFSTTENNNLEQFKKAFLERYEDREVALATALDIEMGIGYLRGQHTSGTDPLLDDLLLPAAPKSSHQEIPWNAITTILHKKLQEVLLSGKQELELTDADFKEQEAVWNDLPDTIASMVELVNLDSKTHLVLQSAGGSSAGNLLGRFCYGEPKLHTLVTKITDKEAGLKPDVIHAEVVHLPESRTGNILRRPALRTHEIPYLGAASVTKSQQLPLEDLTLSMRGGRLMLRSKKYQKEVIPHLTNAHNYSANALPIYHLLCDLQTQGIRSGVSFNWGVLAGQYHFLPRVTYQNIIFSKARWTFKKAHWESFHKVVHAPEKLAIVLQDWRQKYQLPQYLQWVEGDNTLLVNLENITTMQMLLHSIKNKAQVLLEEFLFTKDTIVQNADGAYTNQVVVAFYKQEGAKNSAQNNAT